MGKIRHQSTEGKPRDSQKVRFAHDFPASTKKAPGENSVCYRYRKK